MSHIVICSICSRVKSEDEKLLPARERYLGTHISKVEAEANRKGLPFFILSGVYGFLSAQENVPNYDHLLIADEIPKLATKIREQLLLHSIQEIHFFSKTKPNWQPYLEALKQAAKDLKIRLQVHELTEND